MTDTDDIVNSIVSGISNKPQKPKAAPITIDEDTMQDYIMQKASELVEGGLDAVESLSTAVNVAPDPETAESLAAVVSSTANALKLLSDLNAQNKRRKDAREMEDIRHQHKMEQIEKKGQIAIDSPHTTNVLMITDRESLLRELAHARVMAQEARQETIDVDSQVVAAEDSSEDQHQG